MKVKVPWKTIDEMIFIEMPLINFVFLQFFHLTIIFEKTKMLNRRHSYGTCILMFSSIWRSLALWSHLVSFVNFRGSRQLYLKPHLTKTELCLAAPWTHKLQTERKMFLCAQFDDIFKLFLLGST